MHPPDRLADRLTLIDLNTAFCERLDRNDVPGLIDLFTEDALYVSGEKEAHGKDAIAAYFRARTQDGPRTSRHFTSNLTITFDGFFTARGTSTALSFAEDGQPPLPIQPFLVGDFIDRYVRHADRGWLLAERRIAPVFTRSA